MVDLPNIKIIGLTGMSGAGKSTVRGEFAVNGFYIIDCDFLAFLTAQSEDFLGELKCRFPENLFNPDGTLDRRKTAALIFSDKEKLRLYNMIIFPYIFYAVIDLIKRESRNIILDAPTLFESGLDMICTDIVGVVADRDICAERITARDNITKSDALNRLASQHGREFFEKHCDYIIENNGSIEELEDKIYLLPEQLRGSL